MRPAAQSAASKRKRQSSAQGPTTAPNATKASKKVLKRIQLPVPQREVQPQPDQPPKLPVVVHTYSGLLHVHLIKRYKRFLADVQMTDPDGAVSVVTVHCPNTGSMTGLLDWDMTPACVSKSDNPMRAYAHTLELIKAGPDGPWVGAHAAHANKIMASMLEAMLIPELLPYVAVQKEVKYGQDGKSRVDFLLTRPTDSKVYVEVKCVTLVEDHSEGSGRVAMFPDALSKRAQRHMQDLMLMVEQGHDAAVAFVIPRGDCTSFAPCHARDPVYGQLVLRAAAAGVKIIACRCEIDAPAGQVRYLGQAPLDLEYGLQQP